MESLNSELQKLTPSLNDAENAKNEKMGELKKYIEQAHLTKENAFEDPEYRRLSEEYLDAEKNWNTLLGQQKGFQEQINDIEQDIIPEMKTTFVGVEGSDFENSYNDFITSEQGQAVEGFGGTCGIIASCNMLNQQYKMAVNERQGVEDFIVKGRCEMSGEYGANGGTSYEQRKAFIEENNMTFERVEGSWNGKAIELEDIAKRTQNGESACLVLKAQDLSQEGLSDRRLLPTKQGLTAMKANHDTTIAGFSYDSKGKIAGIWLNDTGGWAGSNRVFISRDKFMQMQKMTDGFAVEYAKRKG